jgi:D-arabinonate dehydratase
MRIAEVRAFTCDVPLGRPIDLGYLRYTTRDYVIVEVRTDAGISGVGVGMARYAPVAEVIQRNLAPLLLGEDPHMVEGLWERMYYANLPIGQRGIFMRALSAVDLALWDIKGKAAGLPVWQLLGGTRTRLPVLVAGGYPGRSLDDLRAEMTDLVDRGFRMIKIAHESLATDTARLRAARQAVGPHTDLALDVHWAWRDISRVASVVREWEDLQLAWIEDPCPMEMPSLTERLRDHTSLPFAIGEDLVGRWAFQEWMARGVVDVVRLDATSAGGLSEAIKVCALASVYGLPISPHIFPEVHVHLGAAFPHIRAIEMTDPPREIDVFYRLLRSSLHIERGDIVAPTAPGLGLELDWDAVAEFSGRREVAVSS